MALTTKATGDIIAASDHNEVQKLLKGEAGAGEQIKLVYNAESALQLQPSSDPVANTDAIEILNNAGTQMAAITFDGRVKAHDGAVGSPGLTFDDDTDTGFYRTGANAVSFAAAGAQVAALAAATISVAGFESAADKRLLAQYTTASSSTALTIDWNNGASQHVPMTGNCTFTFSNPAQPGWYALRLAQDATGSRTATWPATVKWSGATTPTLTTTASRVDLLTFYWDGAAYLGSSILNFTV